MWFFNFFIKLIQITLKNFLNSLKRDITNIYTDANY